MYKIVIDKNILLSALLSKKSDSFMLLELLAIKAEKKYLYNVVSFPVVLEFENILLQPENMERYESFSYEDIKMIIANVIAISYRTKHDFLWVPYLKDDFDDKVLETALNANADAIITHHTKDFQGVEEYFNIDILTPMQLLKKGVL
ncbi:MAG: putative toxin-antitoxin system toxin component, PIN family [Sulfurimonas sp.]|nr:putative toxin-antitoxin system toxin component, PIN family [Sulfurimonas sp.]